MNDANRGIAMKHKRNNNRRRPQQSTPNHQNANGSGPKTVHPGPLEPDFGQPSPENTTFIHLSEMKSKHVTELLEMAAQCEVEGANRMRKQELIFAILKNRARKGDSIYGDGTLEVLPDGFGFLRSPDTSYLASTDDIYVSPSQIRRFNLHTGDSIQGEIRTPKDGDT